MISSFDRNLETARENELQSWIKNKVYTQVSDQGQPRISTRWVYTHKNVNNKQVCKARLVARGFQDRNAGNIRNDSPTCSKEGLRIALAIMASNYWTWSLYLFRFGSTLPFAILLRFNNLLRCIYVESII